MMELKEFMSDSKCFLLALVLFLILADGVYAAEEVKIDTGDTAWILISTALVMLMIPAVGLFYGGMVRRKNALSTIMLSFTILALISVQWVLFGYSLAFGPDRGGIIGSLDWLGLNGVGQQPNADYAATVPGLAFMMFQAMFAVITVALITGAFVERIKFSAFLVFSLLWATLVYDPIAHWVWGVGGWLRSLGTLDFTGGTVVHVSSGISALAIALVIGALAAVFSYHAMLFRMKRNVDESLDVWACHGIGGTWGAIATGIFATTLVNPAGANGLLYGNAGQLLIQIAAVGVTWIYAFVVTFVLAKLIDATIGLRVREEEEAVGLDIAQHAEKAYA
ncbi:MAG: ammonium transporter [Candidatus Methanoperedens sp.]|nr:ammonium transporter [Candidatus Methanoperedens sp.]